MTAYDNGKASTIDVFTIEGKRVARATGDAYLQLKKSADGAGVALAISSGFRTNDEQTYLYGCYQSKACNDGSLAAAPGYSNHQNGRALDLTPGPWLEANASKFGFARTVPSEPWHYEFSGTDPGGPCTGGAKVVSEHDGAPLVPQAPKAAPRPPVLSGSTSTGYPGDPAASVRNPQPPIAPSALQPPPSATTGDAPPSPCGSDVDCPGALTCYAGHCVNPCLYSGPSFDALCPP
jgi:hypothetical protein